MGLFSKAESYEGLESLEAYDRLVDESFRRPVWVLKHSTMCGTSFRALERFCDFAKQSGGSDDAADEPRPRCVVLDIRRHRSVSDAIADRSGVRHQSPQALLLRCGETAWDGSHGTITVAALRQATVETRAMSGYSSSGS